MSKRIFKVDQKALEKELNNVTVRYQLQITKGVELPSTPTAKSQIYCNNLTILIEKVIEYTSNGFTIDYGNTRHRQGYYLTIIKPESTQKQELEVICNGVKTMFADNIAQDKLQYCTLQIVLAEQKEADKAQAVKDKAISKEQDLAEKERARKVSELMKEY